VIDPEVTLVAAVARALDAVGIAPDGDEDIAADFVAALKEEGYVIMRVINGVFPGENK